MFKPYRWKDPIQQRNSKRYEAVALLILLFAVIAFISSQLIIGISFVFISLVLDVIAWRIQAKDKKSK